MQENIKKIKNIYNPTGRRKNNKRFEKEIKNNDN